MKLFCISSIVFTLAIAFVCPQHAYSYSLSNTSAPLIQASPINKAPVIDGKIGADEWAGAGATNIFHKLGTVDLVTPSPKALITYDKDNLYIAMSIPIVPGNSLQAITRPRDAAVWSDDSVEIFIDPEHNQNTSYQFIINAAGSIADLKNQDTDWNGNWQAATSKNSREWSVEVKIPFSTIGVAGISQGSILGLNLTSDRITPNILYSCWAPIETGSYHQPSLYGHLILGPADSAVSGLSFINDTDFGFNISAGSVLNEIKANFIVSQSGKEISNQNVNIIHDGKVSVTMPNKDGHIIDGLYNWKLEAAGHNGVFYRSSGIVNMVTIPKVIVALRKYFIQGKLDVDVDCTGLGLPSQPLTFEAVIKDSKGKQLRKTRVDKKSGYKASFTFDVSKITGSDYTVLVRVLDTSGSELGSGNSIFNKPALPSWVSSKAGRSTKVMPPWTPLKTTVTKSAISISPMGRKYTFTGSPFPSSIITRNASILAGPITMKMVVNGKPFIVKGRLDVIKKTADQAILEGRAAAGDLTVNSRVTIDFDGNSFINLSLSSDKAVKINSFILEAPLKKKHVIYRYYYPGSWGASENCRALPKEGWKSDYLPYVWVGDEDRGFALYSTSDQNWITDIKTKAIEVLPDNPKVMSIRYKIITRPMLLSAKKAKEGIKYTFGFEATPNKTPDKDVWDYRICHFGNYGLEKQMTGNKSSITYSGNNIIDFNKGTLDLWVRVRFNPDEQYTDFDSRGSLNRDLLVIQNSQESLGLYWNIDDRGMRIYLMKGAEYPFALGAKNQWKEGELHHLSLTWGDEIELYVDGIQVLTHTWKGLLNGSNQDAEIRFAGAKKGFDIDELRISRIIREPSVPTSPYTADADTILLDHFDRVKKQTSSQSYTIPDVGTPGSITGSVDLIEGKFGKCIAMTGKQIPMLDYLKNLGVRTIVFHEHWTEYENYPETINNQQNLKNLVKACHEHGIQLLLYFGYLMADICPEFDPYSQEVLVMPRQGDYTRLPKQTDYSVCYNSVWQNFIADGIAKLIDKYDIDGVYLDGTSWPWACTNTAHGCGYVREDGKIAPTYSITGARDMVRRIYTIVKSKKPNGQVNIHNSTTMVIPSMGWATSTWDGEQFGSIARGANMDKLFPLDSFRTEFMGRQWGVPSELLCYDTPYTTHQAFSFTLLHDVLVRGNEQWIEEESALWKTMDKFGRKQAQFRPYWNNSSLVKVAEDRAYATLYVRPGKGVMCVVSNLDKESREVNVTLNLNKMKLDKNVTATNALTNEKIPISDGKFKINLATFDYMLVWVK